MGVAYSCIVHYIVHYMVHYVLAPRTYHVPPCQVGAAAALRRRGTDGVTDAEGEGEGEPVADWKQGLVEQPKGL